jgi:photosystem II stability/assembly factor-like uncharacterized protein
MSKRVLIGTRKGTFSAEKVNGIWKTRLLGHSGAGVNFVARDPHRGTLWAALGHGHWGAKLSRSDDDGVSWTDAQQIKYPDGARYVDTPLPGEDEDAEPQLRFKRAKLLKLWVIAFGARDQIYVGTIPGGLFESSDGGASFSLNLGLWNHDSRGGDLFAGDGHGKTHWFGTPASEGEFAPGIHSILVNPNNPQRMLVAISTAGVLETLDGGKTWQGRNRGMAMDYLPNPAADWGHDPHYITHCQSDPRHVWQQNHCGVFYSSDAAQTWRKVSQPDQGVHFGFPIAVDAMDGKTAWVVPGKSDNERTTVDGSLFVARTHDGGESWQQLRNGLPQDAYDVVYRHALDVSDDAIAFGSTTGNLYLSEDRGDSFASVSHNLPPIYSVRFG